MLIVCCRMGCTFCRTLLLLSLTFKLKWRHTHCRWQYSARCIFAEWLQIQIKWFVGCSLAKHFFFHILGTTRQYFLPFKCAKCHIRLLNLTDLSLYFYISWDVGFWIQFVSTKCKLCDFLVKSAFLFTNIHKPVAKKIG